ncbi:MAG: hypothetical protein DRO23_07640 [Thermoprotei archaeon]|nr:MAG: hypothetical protein DRO23_07640 [Thermoprotei archaeon]
MIIRLIDCLEYIKNLEEKYNSLLEKINRELEKKGIEARVFLAKNMKNIDSKILVKYLGTRVKVYGRVDVSQITLPSRFPLDGFEYIIEEDAVLCSYRVFRKFANVLRQCKIIVNLDNIRDNIVREIIREAYKIRERYSKLLKASINWVPLVKPGVLRKISKTLNISYDDLVDYLAYLKDKGAIKIMFGERGELWLQLS